VRRSTVSTVTGPGGGIGLFLFLLSFVAALSVSGFWEGNNWYNIGNQTVFFLILALGMTVVLISGGIDLSVGATLGLCGGVVANMMADGTPMAVAFLVALLVGTLIGLINGLLITKLRIPDFIATLAMLGVVRGVLFVWTNGIPFVDFINDPYYKIGGLQRWFWEITVPMVVAVVLCLLVTAMLRFTAFGRHLYGVGSNRDAARLSGVNVDRVRIAAYVLSGFLAAVTGILLAGRNATVQPQMGETYEFSAIAAAVMGGAALAGGRGRVLGALLGALTLIVIQNIIFLADVGPTWERVVTGVIILVAVLVDRLSGVVTAHAGRLLRGGAPG
jgi:ribose transport system permease protein